MKLIRYWFEFDMSQVDSPPMGTLMGCGVTAYSIEDAMNILKEKVFVEGQLPPITMEIDNVDISDLDQNHVLPNMGVVSIRGIWFPLGYE